MCDVQFKLYHAFFAQQQERREIHPKMNKEFIENQNVQAKTAVMLPKIDLIAFTGNRLQWI